jgi:hypothetical protein
MELSKEFKEHFVKSLQGKEFILYGGLLELAKQRGLTRITTQVIQIPSKENGMYAVVEAEVTTEDGTFKDIGDASPESVNRAIRPHLLRMASTRAKARAMRDAVGVHMVALEELGGDADILSDQEDDAALQPEDVVLTFGKYANKRLGDLLTTDRNYLEWLSVNARDPSLRDLTKELLEGRDYSH